MNILCNLVRLKTSDKLFVNIDHVLSVEAEEYAFGKSLSFFDTLYLEKTNYTFELFTS